MYLDILVLVILLIGIIVGFKNGIFVEVISIFGFVVILVLTKTYTPTVLKFFQTKDIVFSDNYFITYIFTFIALSLLIGIVMSFIKRALKSQDKGIFNRFLGAIVGGVQTLILVAILMLVYINLIDYVPSLRNYGENSKAVTIMADLIPNFEKYVPEYFLDKFNTVKNQQIIDRNLKKIL